MPKNVILNKLENNLNNSKPLNNKPEHDEINSIVNLLNQGLITEAIKALDQVILEFPDAAILFNLKGAAHQALNEIEKAAENFEKAVIIDPNYAEAFCNLGIVQKKLGLTSKSIESYTKALDINPVYPEAHNNIGNALSEDGQNDLAIDHFEWAVAFNPEFVEAYNNLGFAQRHLNKMDDAISSFKRALKINKKYAKAHLGLGITYKELGLFEQAIKSLEEAIKLDSNYAVAYFNLGLMKEYTFSSEQIKIMESLATSSNINDSDRINLLFALAKLNEEQGNNEKFFEYLHEANRLRKIEVNFSIEKIEQNHSTLKKIFKASPLINLKGKFNDKSSKQPIFILGMPRSGSTLVEQILASHKKVYGAGELQVLRKIISPIFKDYLSQSTKIASTVIGGQSVNFNRNTIITENSFLDIREQYLDVLDKIGVNENIITDKALLNFQFIGFILTSFPDAKIVHLKRDARAICWSIYKTNLPQKGIGFGNNLDDLVKYYHLYLKLMDFWHDLFPNKIYDLNYEELTHNQEEETKKLLKYCDLDWDENCLNFQDTKRAVKTASVLQVRQKMYQGSSEAWKKHEKFLQPLIQGLKSF